MLLFAYGVGAYVVFVLTALYAVGFTDNWIVSQTLDAAPAPGEGGPGMLVSNVLLFALFGLQHWFMGSPAFRAAWARVLPEAAERSTRVLVSSATLMLLFLRWRPIPIELWSFGTNPLGLVLEILSLAGWALAITASVQIGHLQLVGLAQVYAHARGEELEPAEFQLPYLYRWVRHPIYFGIVVAVWCAPTMTVGRMLFAALTTALVRTLAIMEERELAEQHTAYRAYQARVPMLWPRGRPVPLRRRAG